MILGHTLSASEEAALKKDKAQAYANSLNSQIQTNRATRFAQSQQDEAKHKYYLGPSPIPPPTGDVNKEMKKALTQARKEKQSEYQIALDEQVQALKEYRSAPDSFLKILVASESPHKRRAVQSAVSNANVLGIPAPSGVSSQPVGFIETLAGAKNRMSALISAPQSAQADFAVAIENGLIQGDDGETFVDLGVIVVRNLRKGKESVSTSAGVQIPKNYVSQWRQELGSRKACSSVGELIAKENACDAADPHSWLTDKKWAREKLLTNAVQVAMATLE
ncbi:hypothetical protein TrLO_g1237 [Triparma laevis f. longispina]|uniref:inosine/xanthosine triphosphatase n=1 Tax=Triparma laevis f. longispina TaxID=1714387 RepID=A0A9W7AV46_9STRA|nr:hypothetical protein TrLO_g1237 [Triparma laevis f. longispina]